MLVLADTEEPWNGVLVATDKDKHGLLKREFNALKGHPILGKWLYIPHDDEEFEEIVKKLVKYCIKDDFRIGVFPIAKKSKKSSKKRLKKQKTG